MRRRSIDATTLVDDFTYIRVERFRIVDRLLDGWRVATTGWRGRMLGKVAREKLAVHFGPELRVVEQLKASRYLYEAMILRLNKTQINYI